MSQLYLLDTNTVSYIIKGNSRAARARSAALFAHESPSVAREAALFTFGRAILVTNDAAFAQLSTVLPVVDWATDL